MPRKTKQNDITSPELLSQVNDGVAPDGYYGFIYITSNLINGKKYIGQKKFIPGWKRYIGSGHAFLRAVDKYGRDNFKREIIELCKAADELNRREIYWINQFDAVKSPMFYNLMDGGNAGNKLEGYSAEWRSSFYERCAKSRIGIPKKYKSGTHPLKGTHRPEETKKKISNANKGKRAGEENYAARSVICVTTGEIFGSISEAQLAYKIKNVSSCCSGKRYHAGKLPNGTPLTWAYYDKVNHTYNPPKDLNERWSKNKVEQYTTLGEYLSSYGSARAASDITGICYQNIIAVCTGTKKTAGGYVWKYSSTCGGVTNAS